jgi:autotransporter-associated beta strand protein
MSNTTKLPIRDYRASILVAGLFAALAITPSAQAADIVKANNAQALNLEVSWTGGIVPGTQDRAVFDQTVVGNKTTSLGADAAWSGVLLSGNANTWTINGAFTLALGAGGVDLSLASANFAFAAPLSVRLDASQTWTVTNGRQITVSAPLAGTGDAQLVKDGEGTLVINTNSAHSGGTVLNGGTLYLSGANTFGGALTISNGVLALDGTGSVTASESVHISDGARLDVSAWADGYTVAPAQTLTGYGSVTGSVVVASGARLSAGNTNAVGTLTFKNDLTLSDGAVINWNVDPASGATDIIRVNGTLRLPEHATIRISGTDMLPKLRILFKASKIEGAGNARKWTILNGHKSLHASVNASADQIVLLYTGLIVTLK